MTYHNTPPIVEPPQGWCNEPFEFDNNDSASVAPLVKTYLCRLPKGHDPSVPHACFASRIGR